ncbi:hypothetical protein D3C77_71710 [compost metagenome]
MLAEQGNHRRGTDNGEHEQQALAAADVDVPAKATDDSGDAHEAAVGVEGGNGHLAESDAEVQQCSGGTGAPQAHDVGHFTPGKLAVGDGGGEHPEDHRRLGADHRTQAGGEEGLERGGAAWQVAGVVRHIRTEGDLPGRRQRHREQERGPGEVAVFQQLADVGNGHDAAEQVDEGDDPQHAGDAPDPVDHAVAGHRGEDDDRGEDQDPGTVADAQQLADGLAGEHRAGGGEAQVHQAHQGNRDGRAIDTELHAAGNHLRQAQLGALGCMQGHDRAAGQLADQQADQRPEHIAAQHHGQGPGDDGSDLQVGTQPQGELAVEASVPFILRDVVNRAALDQGLAARGAGLGHCCGSPHIVVVERSGHRPDAGRRRQQI